MGVRDKAAVVDIAKELLELGFSLISTEGTQTYLSDRGLNVERILKLHEGRPHVVDAIKNHEVSLIINTPSGGEAQLDGRKIRRSALLYKVPLITTLAGARATVAAIRSLQTGELGVKSIQEYHQV